MMSISEGIPAPSSAKYGEGRVPTYSVGQTVNAAPPSRACSQVASAAWRGASPARIGMSSTSNKNHSIPASRNGASFVINVARSFSDS